MLRARKAARIEESPAPVEATNRLHDPHVLVDDLPPAPIERFTTYADVQALAEMPRADAAAGGKTNEQCIVKGLLGARRAGSTLVESGVSVVRTCANVQGHGAF